MIFFYVFCVTVILASKVYGNNLTQLESKMIGGTYADELADKFKVYPVYISKLGIPFLTGIRITLGHVLTVATHLDEIQARLRDYKVHYKNPKNPGQKLDRIGVEAVKKHPNYIEGEEFTPFNVGFIQTSGKMKKSRGQLFTRFFDEQKLPLKRMTPVYVFGWNTVNDASGAGRNELHELKFLPVEIMLDAMKNNPSVIPLKITIDTGMLKEIDRGCPVVHEGQILGIISNVPENTEEPIYMVNSQHFHKLFPSTPNYIRDLASSKDQVMDCIEMLQNMSNDKSNLT